MPASDLHRQLATLTAQLAGRELNEDLQDWLNLEHGVDSATFAELVSCCREGVAKGWLCEHEAGGIRYGRVFKPSGWR